MKHEHLDNVDIGAYQAYDETDETRSRLDICNTCEEYNKTTRTCAQCSCFMPLKVLMPFVKCPLGKWEMMGDDKRPLYEK
jgi:hypothetical protein